MQPLMFPGVFILNCFLFTAWEEPIASLLNMLCTSTNPLALAVHRLQRDIPGWRVMKAIATVILIALLLTYHWTETHWLAKLILAYVEVSPERKEGVFYCTMSLGRIRILPKRVCSLWLIWGTFFTWVLGCAAVHLEWYITKSVWFIIWFDPAVLTERLWELHLNKEGKLGFLFLNSLWKQIWDQQLPRWKVYGCQIFSTFHLNYLVLVSIHVFN